VCPRLQKCVVSGVQIRIEKQFFRTGVNKLRRTYWFRPRSLPCRQRTPWLLHSDVGLLTGYAVELVAVFDRDKFFHGKIGKLAVISVVLFEMLRCATSNPPSLKCHSLQPFALISGVSSVVNPIRNLVMTRRCDRLHPSFLSCSSSITGYHGTAQQPQLTIIRQNRRVYIWHLLGTHCSY
jgi:hypothetical protein